MSPGRRCTLYNTTSAARDVRFRSLSSGPNGYYHIVIISEDCGEHCLFVLHRIVVGGVVDCISEHTKLLNCERVEFGFGFVSFRFVSLSIESLI